MKNFILKLTTLSVSLLFMSLCLTTMAVAQLPDSSANGGSGSSGTTQTILTIVGAVLSLGVGVWLTYRGNKFKDLLVSIIDAAQDKKVTEAEFQKIIAAAKAIISPKEDDNV